jgi:hypothetical protein
MMGARPCCRHGPSPARVPAPTPGAPARADRGIRSGAGLRRRLDRDARLADAAAVLFAALPQRPLHRLFRERCDAFAQSPPPPDWDGATNFATK